MTGQAGPDGVYETLCFRNGAPWQPARHEARMRRGAEAMDLPFPAEAWADAMRQSGDLMLRLDLDRDGQLVQTPRPLVAHPVEPLRIITASKRLQPSPWHGLKLAHMPLHQAARDEAAAAGVDDAILGCGEMVAEATTANVFAWIDGVCHAPGPDSGAVDGVTRQVLLEDGHVEPLRIADLGRVDAMALTNVRGVRIVGELDGRPLDLEPAKALRARFEALVS